MPSSNASCSPTDGARDEELVLLFNRRLWRAHQLMGPAGSAMTKHLPIQRFR